MANAIRAKDHPQWKDKLDARRQKIEAVSSPVRDKTWDQLTPEEKDALLKIVCIRLGLVKADGDQETPGHGRRDRRNR